MAFRVERLEGGEHQRIGGHAEGDRGDPFGMLVNGGEGRRRAAVQKQLSPDQHHRHNQRLHQEGPVAPEQQQLAPLYRR